VGKVSKTAQSGVSCHNCPAMCCRYVASEIDAPTSKREYDNIRWYLMHRDVFVFVDHEDDWYLEFETACENLGADNRCQRYEERPRICREHGDTDVDCEFHAGTEPHKIRFSTAAEFEAWLDSQGIKWRRKAKR
jgi:Fe-S-cluster containining protein